MANHGDGATAGEPAHTNRLIHETSPYLLQHAHNPVDWYPWGEEAFARARAEDKPILLSIGYSACHWCHVLMAHESFENEETAALMNARYVCVKVDREERPDVDALYMEATIQMTGGGGWPMTVFLTPDGAPFLAGTYFPPEPRHGLPGFPTVLTRIADWYATKRDEVEEQAQAVREMYRTQAERTLPMPPGLLEGEAALDPTVLAPRRQRRPRQFRRAGRRTPAGAEVSACAGAGVPAADGAAAAGEWRGAGSRRGPERRPAAAGDADPRQDGRWRHL